MKVEVGVISQSWRLRLVALTETLIILDITKTESNNIIVLLYIYKKMVTTMSGKGNLFLNV